MKNTSKNKVVLSFYTRFASIILLVLIITFSILLIFIDVAKTDGWKSSIPWFVLFFLVASSVVLGFVFLGKLWNHVIVEKDYITSYSLFLKKRCRVYLKDEVYYTILPWTMARERTIRVLVVSNHPIQIQLSTYEKEGDETLHFQTFLDASTQIPIYYNNKAKKTIPLEDWNYMKLELTDGKMVEF